MADEVERRKSVLTESDVERISKAFAGERDKFFELIGYDVTTPESRGEIRDDHRFIRLFRKSAVWIVGTVLVAVAGAAAAGWVG